MPDAGTVSTEDTILGGRLRIAQPARGHRVGHDAVLLAACTEAKDGEHAVELGAGVGAAALALGLRVPGLRLTLIDIDRDLVEFASANIAANGFSGRARAIALDAAAPARAYAAAGLVAGSVQRVLMNPPFNDPGRARASPEAGRRLAHSAPAAPTLKAWVSSAARLLALKGVLTLVWRADGCPDVIAALQGRFGDIAMRPVHPRPGAAAIRVLVRAVRGSRAPFQLLPGLVLADDAGRPTAAAEAILRDAAALPFRV